MILNTFEPKCNALVPFFRRNPANSFGFDLSALLPKIQSIIYQYSAGVTAYNRDFDFGFLESRGILFPAKLPCSMKLATPLCKVPAYPPLI